MNKLAERKNKIILSKNDICIDMYRILQATFGYFVLKMGCISIKYTFLE